MNCDECGENVPDNLRLCPDCATPKHSKASRSFAAPLGSASRALNAEIVRTKIKLIELEKDSPKKTTCHCGKPLNEDGLCWCCDPISTCWPQ